MTCRGVVEVLEASDALRARLGLERPPHYSTLKRFAVGSLLPAALVASRGLHDDKREARPPSEKARQAMRPGATPAGAGYDAERVHEYCRDDRGVASAIKPVAHRADSVIRGARRSRMTEDFLKESGYGRRWAVESFMSGLKRTTGAALGARSERPLFVEAALRVPAYALRRWPEPRPDKFSTRPIPPLVDHRP